MQGLLKKFLSNNKLGATMGVGALPSDILKRVHSDFEEHDAAAAARMLEAYEGPERDRVVRCILHLAAGALDRLTHFVEASASDYRDVIYWAEYDANDRHVRDFSRAFACAKKGS